MSVTSMATTSPASSQRFSPARRSNLYFVWRGVLGDPVARIAAVIIFLLVLCAIFAPYLAPFPPNEADPALRLQPPGTPGHLLGLDHQGRDILSRLIYGARLTLLSGVVPVILGAAISIPLGLIGAWYPRLGEVVMRVMDVFFAFPMALLAIMLAALMGPGLGNMMIALVVTLIPYNTRVVYAAASQERELAYIEAAKAMATSDLKILFVEMLPNVVAASVVYSCTIVGAVVITAAGLSFLGLGVQPPIAEWGIMTSEGRSYVFVAPHIAALPGLAITVLVMAFNLLGDSLRDSLDPKTRLQLVKHRAAPSDSDEGKA
ncbi:ABC transporter permease [Aminobacter aganoensis]|uniref:Peptide/nickel transport system permease protein n=1 Tax=Aminobacter aganoensis TaxID=83264 RepID=A0A7X0FBL4_9HYPH|nr:MULTISPECIES: ABC transporter permease [Aminobacter]MBB6356696.1 peptide/nickel transport system permease protein [Aminobacter aganoensis]